MLPTALTPFMRLLCSTPSCRRLLRDGDRRGLSGVRRPARKGLQGFRRFCRLQTRAAGTLVHRLQLGGQTFFHFPGSGALSFSHPYPAYTESTQVLLSLLHEEVAFHRAELTRFFAVVARGGVLDDWYDRPFSGQWRAEQEPVPQAAAQ